MNLLYGAFFQHHEPDKLIESLLDRLMALKLVQVGLSGVAMFGPDREVLQPSEVLRKKAVLVERGSFRPPTHVNVHLDNYQPEFLTIFSRDVLRRIAAGDDSWERMVPCAVAELIKRRGFFGYAKADRY